MDPYKFAIFSESGKYWQTGTGGFTGTIVELPTAKYYRDVVDWNKLALSYKRDMVLLGVIRSYSPNMVRFVRDFAKILRYIKNTQGGIEAVAYLSVNLLNKDTQQYELLDYWQFDFSKTNNQLNYYDIALMEGGLSALLKAYAASYYNIALNDPALAPNYPLYNPLPADVLSLAPPTNIPIIPADPTLILMDGIPILGRLDYVTSEIGESNDMINGPDVGVTPPVVASLGCSNTNKLGDYTIGVSNIVLPSKKAGIDTIVDTALFREAKTTASRIKIRYNLNFNCAALSSAGNIVFIRLRYALYQGDATNPALWGAQIGGIGAAGIIKEDTIGVVCNGIRPVHGPQLNWFGISDAIDLPANSILVVGFSYKMVGAVSGLESVGAVFAPTDTTPASVPLPAIMLEYTFIPEPSICRGITWGQLFEQLTAQMSTNGGLLQTIYPSRSNLLNTFRNLSDPGNWDLNPFNVYFTCGDSLRGLKVITVTDPFYNGGLPFDTYIVPAIYTNMQDFAKDLFTDAFGGIGIEKNGIGTDKLVAESLYYFFDDNTVIADLGDNINNFTMEDFNDWRGSSITIGQADQQFDAINGPLETISQVDLSAPLTRIIKNIDMRSPYRSDPYGIELIRANIGNKTNINSSSDNDVVKLHLRGRATTPVAVLGDWTGLSGYETSVDCLFLHRANNIASGLPDQLLTPGVLPYAMYNGTFTPHRKALRMLPWLCSNYRGLLDELIGITGCKKNIKLQSNYGSGLISESDWLNVSAAPNTYTPPFSTNPVTVAPAPIPAGRTTALLFLPYVFSFTGPAIKGLPKKMTPPGTVGGGLQYGKIKFTFKRKDKVYQLAGFPLDISVTPGSNDVCNYRLLASPTVVIPNDL